MLSFDESFKEEKGQCCVQCGKPLSRWGRVDRRFCSQECKNHWHNMHRMRDYLLENNVSLYEVMLLEDNLVRSVEKGQRDCFPSLKLIENIGPDLKNAVISFAGSAAVTLLFP